MRPERYSFRGKQIVRVSKKLAMKLWAEGIEIGFAPANLRVGMYCTPYFTNLNFVRDKTYDGANISNDELFETTRLNFEWYNCNYSETGRYAKYFAYWVDLSEDERDMVSSYGTYR